MSKTEDALQLLHQGLTLYEQAIALLEQDAEATGFTTRDLARIARVGEMAHLHLAALEAKGQLTLAESRAIRRELAGAKIRSTANLFGTKGSGAVLYRLVEHGTKVGAGQEVRLTSEGEWIAKAYRTLHGIG